MYWIVEIKHRGRWVPKGGNKRRRYESQARAEDKARAYRERHPQRDVRVRKVPRDQYADVRGE